MKYQNTGLGTTDKQQPISVKYPPKVDAILRNLPKRSDKIRQWVLEGMRREGLLKE
ncbi:hypothetical protein AB0756_39795 [Tolypothrix campylonemoides VB511288_2]|uniref:Uncharacterized protein n=1 Tax=Tolypothrix campylonemoides VB511288_2 TaxID=3232311 RepID=A0ABW8XNV9_9CYAN